MQVFGASPFLLNVGSLIIATVESLNEVGFSTPSY